MMRLHIAALVLVSPLALAASTIGHADQPPDCDVTCQTFSFPLMSAYYAGMSDADMTFSGPDGTWTGTSGFISTIGPVFFPPGSTTSFTLPFAGDVVGVSGTIDGQQVSGGWCVGGGNFSVGPVTVPAVETSQNITVTVPVLGGFSGAGGLVFPNSSCSVGFANPFWLFARPVPGGYETTLTFIAITAGQQFFGWQLSTADFAAVPEPRSRSLACVALFLLAPTIISHRLRNWKHADSTP